MDAAGVWHAMQAKERQLRGLTTQLMDSDGRSPEAQTTSGAAGTSTDRSARCRNSGVRVGVEAGDWSLSQHRRQTYVCSSPGMFCLKCACHLGRVTGQGAGGNVRLRSPQTFFCASVLPKSQRSIWERQTDFLVKYPATQRTQKPPPLPPFPPGGLTFCDLIMTKEALQEEINCLKAELAASRTALSAAEARAQSSLTAATVLAILREAAAAEVVAMRVELERLHSSRKARTEGRPSTDAPTAQEVAAVWEGSDRNEPGSPVASGAGKVEVSATEVKALREENRSLREAAQDWGFEKGHLELEKIQGGVKIARLEARVKAMGVGV